MKLRIYLASRPCDEHSLHRAELLQVVANAYPEAEIIDGVAAWADDDWLTSWQKLLPTLDRVILVPGVHGEVGLGGLQEVLDALLAPIPVEVVTPAGVRPLERLTLGAEVLDLENVAVAT